MIVEAARRARYLKAGRVRAIQLGQRVVVAPVGLVSLLPEPPQRFIEAFSHSCESPGCRRRS